jgi:hypothetical protein
MPPLSLFSDAAAFFADLARRRHAAFIDIFSHATFMILPPCRAAQRAIDAARVYSARAAPICYARSFYGAAAYARLRACFGHAAKCHEHARLLCTAYGARCWRCAMSAACVALCRLRRLVFSSLSAAPLLSNKICSMLEIFAALR